MSIILKRLSLFFFCLVCVSLCKPFAQEPCAQLDSVSSFLTQNNLKKSTEIDLIALAKKCPDYPIEQLSILLYKQLETLLTERKHEIGIRAAHNYLAYLKVQVGYHDTLSIRILSLLGANNRCLYRYDSTFYYYDHALALYEKYPTTQNDPYYCIFLRGVAVAFFHTYQYPVADSMFRICLSCHEMQVHDTLNESISIRVLASFLREAGQIDSAEYYLQKAIDLNHSHSKPSMESTIYGYARLRNIALRKGDAERAHSLLRKMLHLYEEHYSSDYLDAVIFRISYEYERLSEQTIRLDEYLTFIDSIGRVPAYKRPYANGLFNAGKYLLSQRKYPEALHSLLQADSLYQHFYQSAETRKYQARLSLYEAYKKLGDYSLASTMLESFYAPILSTHPPDHNKLGNYYHQKSQLYFLEGSRDAALQLAEKGARINRNYVASFATFCSEYELEKTTSNYIFDMEMHRNMAWRHPDRSAGFASICYDDALFLKGFVLKNNQSLRQEIAANPEAIHLQNQVLSTKTALSIASTNPNISPVTLKNLEEKSIRLEKEIARTLRSGRPMPKPTDWTKIAQALESDAAALEYVKFRLLANDHSLSDSIVYAALLLRKGLAPIFIPLCSESELEKEFKNRTTQMYASQSTLYHLIWKPLEAELAGIGSVWVSPTGLLHRISFGALMVGSGQHNLHIHTVTSTRDILNQASRPANVHHALLFGGLDYENANATSNATFQDLTYEAPSHSFDAHELRGRTWDALKWTKQEVDSIEQMLRHANYQTIMYFGAEGTEEVFKSIGKTGPSPSVLHLSTHGYFFPDPKEQIESDDDAVWVRSEHPLVRSGLILSGGNIAWKSQASIQQGAEDGILTALEISQMDLTNTDLVVLSACETGLGDIKGAEGVYGLQRAFQVAGAKNIMMSLWQVPDWHTKELMVRFYHQWLTLKLPISAALAAAQLSMAEEGYEPFYWAGFVVLE